MKHSLLGALFLCALAAPAMADADPHCSHIGEISCACGNSICWSAYSLPGKWKEAPDTGGPTWINGAIDYGTKLGPIVQRMSKADMKKEKSK
jgi:hypothetical protein